MLSLHPLGFRRRLRKIYRRQELDQPWTIRLEATGIQSTVHGKADTRFEWAYFDRYVETADLFTLIQTKRPAFITLPKWALNSDEQAELRRLLRDHIPAKQNQ